VLIFATSDKGGTGRSVTSTNIAYRRALMGSDVCYLDFDFGSPTAGAIFDIEGVGQGTKAGGLHSYFYGETAEPLRLDVWKETDRPSLRDRPPAAGRLVLLPGDNGGGEFPCDSTKVRACIQLLLQLESEFDVTFIDLSAGRSYATQMVLTAIADARMRKVASRWLVFHRWTKQHIGAASNLAYGDKGLIQMGVAVGLSEEDMYNAISFVRTAVVDPGGADLAGLSAEQVTWLRSWNRRLYDLAKNLDLGRTRAFGEVPLEPVLQWREQLIADDDVLNRMIANPRTTAAFSDLAHRLTDDVRETP
jgi:MinD-like ATPase involved in chromosome partitioning or flagellar assembly